MREIKGIKLSDMLFIDTETARLESELVEGTPTFDAWEYLTKKEAKKDKDFNIFEDYKARAGLYAEFSRLVCITVGRVNKDGELVLTTYKDEDEAELLSKFNGDLDLVCKSKPDLRLVGHSVKQFDIPFMFRRGIVNGVVSNRLIDVGGVKPWDLTALDTKDLWKGTGYMPASLVAVCLALGIPTPKSDIDGSQVGDVYHSEGESGVERIAKYCERDVLAVANVIRKFRFELVFTNFISKEPKIRKELGLMEVIARDGVVNKDNEKKILERVIGKSIQEKEKTISIVKSALLVTGAKITQELELKILSA